MTLKFFPNSDPDILIRKLEPISFFGFDLAIDSVGAFPYRTNPRIIWAGISASDALSDLKKDIDSLLGPDDRLFHPHITLARLRTPKVFNETIDQVRFRVAEFCLFSSILTPEGPRYSKLHTFTAKGI